MKPFPMKSFPMEPFTLHTCLECSRRQKTCCDNSRVPLTIADIERIEQKGWKLEQFAFAGEYSEKDCKENETWWRESMVMREGKAYHVNTKRKKDDSCIFLQDGKGCRLGKDRPLVCKIYPFWVNSEGHVTYEDGEQEYCFFGKNGAPLSEGLKIIEENAPSIKSYFEQIREDCLKNNELRQKLVERLLREPEYGMLL